jgi:hypothetical protein
VPAWLLFLLHLKSNQTPLFYAFSLAYTGHRQITLHAQASALWLPLLSRAETAVTTATSRLQASRITIELMLVNITGLALRMSWLVYTSAQVTFTVKGRRFLETHARRQLPTCFHCGSSATRAITSYSIADSISLLKQFRKSSSTCTPLKKVHFHPPSSPPS